jgi:hypothetical protein
VLPFERLRALARYHGDDPELVLEAADCLADFGPDPTHLVTVCRRLLAHHPRCGPLWWLCAHVVSSPDPGPAARAAARALRDDPTAARLTSALPFPHDGVVAVLGWPPAIADALAERPDLDVAVVRGRGLASVARLRGRGASASVRVVDATEAGALDPTHLLVGTEAAGPHGALVPAGTGDLLRSLDATAVWLVVPAGRLLPDRLFATLLEARADEDGDGWGDDEELDLTGVAAVVTPAGLDRPDQLARRVDCPVAPELLRR